MSLEFMDQESDLMRVSFLCLRAFYQGHVKTPRSSGVANGVFNGFTSSDVWLGAPETNVPKDKDLNSETWMQMFGTWLTTWSRHQASRQLADSPGLSTEIRLCSIRRAAKTLPPPHHSVPNVEKREKWSPDG